MVCPIDSETVQIKSKTGYVTRAVSPRIKPRSYRQYRSSLSTSRFYSINEPVSHFCEISHAGRLLRVRYCALPAMSRICVAHLTELYCSNWMRTLCSTGKSTTREFWRLIVTGPESWSLSSTKRAFGWVKLVVWNSSTFWRRSIQKTLSHFKLCWQHPSTLALFVISKVNLKDKMRVTLSIESSSSISKWQNSRLFGMADFVFRLKLFEGKCELRIAAF